MGQRTQPPSCVKSVTRDCTVFDGEEGGADVKSAWPLYPGLHTCYNEESNELRKHVSVSKSLKPPLSRDCGLQLDHMKLESLVIADQQAAVNTFSGLVHTARQVMGMECSRRSQQGSKEKFVTVIKAKQGSCRGICG